MTLEYVAFDSHSARRASGLEGGTTLLHQRPHVALGCEIESSLKIGPSFGAVAFRQIRIAQQFQRVGLLRRLAALYRERQGPLP
jgi:hypothetical protein